MDMGQYRRMVSVLATPLSSVKGVGPKIYEKLTAKGVRTLGDALGFLPIRHEDRTRPTPLAQLEPDRPASFRGTLISLREQHYSRARTLEGVLQDDSGRLDLKWFRGNFKWLADKYKVGSELFGHGTVKLFRNRREVVHPDLEVISEEGGADPEGVVPVYSEVDGVHPKRLRKIMREAVEQAAAPVFNMVPAVALAAVGEDPAQWAQIGNVWRELHLPGGGGPEMDARLKRCRDLIVLEEFFFLQLGLLLKRAGEGRAGISFSPDFSIIKPLLASLPFDLTGAQRRVLSQIRRDMEEPRPMHRLLQGDVGSGKTLVALMSALMAVESGYQAALMAPTEVLAEQHMKNLSAFLENTTVRVGLLTGSVTGAERARVSGLMAAGELDIAVGTHALIQDEVRFKNLGLVIVDEQHRFGVMQRAGLAAKGEEPDLLVMTATPIPRSLSMTVYGDLDLAVIDELPPGRTPVKTSLVKNARREAVYDFVRKEVAAGRQAYVVYPLVEETDKSEMNAAVEMCEAFRCEVFPELTVGLLHGRMKGEEKEQALSRFYGGETNVLVCTTVIEVGIDVPNATVMVIEHAERYGLSQLHQLRGRVGRGRHASHCVLIAGEKLSNDAFQRLKIMAQTEDGFRIAEEDLKIRGPGDMLGTRQSGMPDFRIGNILRDGPLLEKARTMAHAVLEADPTLKAQNNSVLRRALYDRWAEKLSLVQSG